jgi:surface carbohydrate biosynthesis protein (TIGR04326 family)
LRGIRLAFRPLGSSFSLWPLMRGDWYSSLRGPGAISSLLWLELFDLAMRDLPRQSKGLYLCENQAWERALIHSWRKHGHGQLIAVPHSTVRYWDLRYITDPRTVRSENALPLPQPDLVALNGMAAIDAYRSADYPNNAIVECEALRYSYLNELRTRPASRRAMAPGLKVLILGDYFPANTIKMLELLEAAVAQMSVQVEFTVKSHPSYAVKLANYPSLHLQAVDKPLDQILHGFDIAYSSNVTSAALDAYLSGLAVVVMLDAAELNFSPLRGQPGVRFVSTAGELNEALRSADQGPAGNHNPKEFFFLDPELPRWKRVLGIPDC